MSKSYYDAAVNLVKSGIDGTAIYLPLTRSPNSDELSKLGKYISIGKSQFILLGGLSGSGKTSIVDSQFVLNLYYWWLRHRETTNIKPYWIYRSMERPAKYKILKWMAYLMFVEHKILTDTNILAGKPSATRKITDVEIKLVKEYEKFFDEMWTRLELISGVTNPTGIYKYSHQVAEQKGKKAYTFYDEEIKKNIFVINGVKHGELVNFEENNGRKRFYIDVDVNGINYRHFEYDTKYFANDPNEIVFHLTDHVGCVRSEKGMGDKQTLDKYNEYMAYLRDVFEWSPITIQQLNRDVESSARWNDGNINMTNQDFKGTGNIYESSDLVIGLMNPYKLKADAYLDYDVPMMLSPTGENRLRSYKIIKNSDGIDDIEVGFLFLGEMGLIADLPKGLDMKQSDYVNIQKGNFEKYIK